MLKRINQYLQPAWYNIRQNRMYAFFALASSALTFVFIALVLQLMYIYGSDYRPMNNADRIFRLESFETVKGRYYYGIPSAEVGDFLEGLKDLECVSLYHKNMLNIDVNGQLFQNEAGFVNSGFWEMYGFDFIYGKPFTVEDMLNQKQVVVVTESIAQSFFRTKDAVGKRIAFQGREYAVAGVVKDISSFASPTDVCAVWVPHIFNRFIPNRTYRYLVDVFLPPAMSMDEGKAKISTAVKHFFKKKDIDIAITPQKLHTRKEVSVSNAGGALFKYGGATALLLLLVIPALNILLLNIANSSSQAEEIAVRRTFGATRISAFSRSMTENLLLVVSGSLIGLTLASPVINAAQQFLAQGTFINVSMIPRIDFFVILSGVLPSIVVFSLLSGSLPAYLISRSNMAQILKGGSK
ncbi:MAG: ABC transporter permease [Dysgonamonadaceae bacterium]|jgi:ABC-type antimicrobial peptide transport system permease subunit|nr:ABC transporter permease [Dysgonamonadaceae bacterium]